jgi:hypothetical protein
MIMIVENDPGSQSNMRFSSQHFELVANKIFMADRPQQVLSAVNRGSDKVPGIIEVDMRRVMVRHARSEIDPAEASSPDVAQNGVEASAGLRDDHRLKPRVRSDDNHKETRCDASTLFISS